MTFCLRQLVAEASTEVFLQLVDLCKVYNSVPRTLLWQNYGVRDAMIDELIQSLHVGMFATVADGGGKSEPPLAQNNLWQGCTLAPTLFILYFGQAIDNYHYFIKTLTLY